MVQRVATVEERLRRVLGSALLSQEPLRHHTTLRTGGQAAFYCERRTPAGLVTALARAHEMALRCSCSAAAATCSCPTPASAAWSCTTPARRSSSTEQWPTWSAAPI